jgi:hypothetical protein
MRGAYPRQTFALTLTEGELPVSCRGGRFYKISILSVSYLQS